MYSVYKHWDKDGVLLYVGCTKNLAQRNSTHYLAHWYGDIDCITHDEFPDRKSALAEEKRLICDELPKYNKRHHPDNDNLVTRLPMPNDSNIITPSGDFDIEYLKYLMSKKCRDEAGSMRKFALANGFSAGYVSQVINGKSPPSKRLLKAMGINPKVSYVKITPDYRN